MTGARLPKSLDAVPHLPMFTLAAPATQQSRVPIPNGAMVGVTGLATLLAGGTILDNRRKDRIMKDGAGDPS